MAFYKPCLQFLLVALFHELLPYLIKPSGLTSFFVCETGCKDMSFFSFSQHLTKLFSFSSSSQTLRPDGVFFIQTGCKGKSFFCFSQYLAQLFCFYFFEDLASLQTSFLNTTVFLQSGCKSTQLYFSLQIFLYLFFKII